MHDRTQPKATLYLNIPDVKHQCVRDVAAESIASASSSIGKPAASERSVSDHPSATPQPTPATGAYDTVDADERSERETYTRRRRNFGYDPFN